MYNMYNPYNMYQNPYYFNTPMHNANNMYNAPLAQPYIFDNTQMYNTQFPNQYPHKYAPFFSNEEIKLKDYGPDPFVVNIEKATKQNDTFRTALWTGKYLQLTLMSINVGEDIGLERHRDRDQFIRIEEGEGVVKMGNSKEKLDFERRVYDDYVIFIPAGKWHNLINTGHKPIKLYSIYAPPEHPHSTVHKTKEIAQASESHHNH